MRRDWIAPVSFLIFAVVIIVYDASTKRKPGIQPSGDVYLTAEQWGRVADHIGECERRLTEAGLPIPAGRPPNGSTGRPERSEHPQRPST